MGPLVKLCVKTTPEGESDSNKNNLSSDYDLVKWTMVISYVVWYALFEKN